MILRVLKQDKELRQQIDTKAEAQRKLEQGTKKPTTLLPATHNAPAFAQGHTVSLEHINAQAPDNHTTKRQNEVRHFLATATWKPTTGQQNGTSYSEQFTRFKLLGGTTTTNPCNNWPAPTPPTHNTQHNHHKGKGKGTQHNQPPPTTVNERNGDSQGAIALSVVVVAAGDVHSEHTGRELSRIHI